MLLIEFKLADYFSARHVGISDSQVPNNLRGAFPGQMVIGLCW